MSRFIYLTILFNLLFSECNSHNQKTLVTKDSSDIKVKSNITSDVANDTGNQELKNIIDDFKKQYNANYNLDTLVTRGGDTFKIVFKYKCLFDSGLLIPEKYVGIYGIKTFQANNFEARFILNKNNRKLIDDKITKGMFTHITNENLKRYGALLYPTLKIEDSLIKVHFSISIPLTDVGAGFDYDATFNGQIKIKSD